MKQVPFNVFGENEYLYYDIGRLIQVENQTGKSATDIIIKQDLNLGFITVLLSVGLRHHGLKSPQWYADKFSRFEITLDDVAVPIAKALIGTGIMGKQLYYATFPEELTEKVKNEMETSEKN